MNILFYGDSNTWGFQGDQPQVRLAYEKRFTGIIANRFPQHHIIEEGLPGRTICINDPLDKGRNGMETLPMLLQTHEPLDLVVIMLGTNDTKIMFGHTPDDHTSGNGTHDSVGTKHGCVVGYRCSTADSAGCAAAHGRYRARHILRHV